MKIRNLLILAIIISSAATFTQCNKMLSKAALRTNQRFAKDIPYDIIIVPGYPHNTEEWDRVVQMRVLWAKKLYDEGKTKNIMFSGAAVYTPYVESKAMAKFAEAMGVPKENLFTEENAKHSTENLYYSYVRAKELGFQKIALATDPFQTSSLKSFRKKYKIEVGLMPIVFSEIELLDHTQPEITVKQLDTTNFVPLNEIETFAERWQGTLGNNIRWREQDIKSDRMKKVLERKGRLIKSPDYSTAKNGIKD